MHKIIIAAGFALIVTTSGASAAGLFGNKGGQGGLISTGSISLLNGNGVAIGNNSSILSGIGNNNSVLSGIGNVSVRNLLNGSGNGLLGNGLLSGNDNGKGKGRHGW